MPRKRTARNGADPPRKPRCCDRNGAASRRATGRRADGRRPLASSRNAGMGVAVTGANRRIGLEFVRSFQRRGDDVVAICRRASAQLHDTGAELVTGVDVGAAAAVDELTRQLGPSPLDVLVNNVRGRKLPFSPAGSDRSPTMPRGGLPDVESGREHGRGQSSPRARRSHQSPHTC